MLKTNFLITGLALAASAAVAQAEMATTTISDIEVRSGPGQQYPVVGMATRGSDWTLDGCIAGSRWCRIELEQNGIRGWVYAQYLSVQQNGTPVIVRDHGADLNVPEVTYSQDVDTSSTGSVAPGPAQPGPNDELLGPVDQVDAITPPETVRTYIDENPGDTVQLEGDVVVGAAIPRTVTVHEIPDYQYTYARVNGQPVLIDPRSHRIVYVYQ